MFLKLTNFLLLEEDCPYEELMDEPDDFTPVGIQRPDLVEDGFSPQRRRDDTIEFEPNFPGPYFRLLILRFTTRNVRKVRVRIFKRPIGNRPPRTIEEEVRF